MEHRQTTGSFKLRGASNAVALLSPAEKSRGVVAASTGNHGRALAHAAKLEGVRAVICMSRLVPENKLAEIRRLGADIRIVGDSQDDAQDEVDRLVREENLTMVPPFDHPAVIAGQGTLGLEMIEAIPAARTVLVQLSGGGLAAGIAAAVKGVSPTTRVIGVSMQRGAAMKASIDAGKPMPVTGASDTRRFAGRRHRPVERLHVPDVQRPARRCRPARPKPRSRPAFGTPMRSSAKWSKAPAPLASPQSWPARSGSKAISSSCCPGRNIDMDLHRSIVCGDMDE